MNFFLITIHLYSLVFQILFSALIILFFSLFYCSFLGASCMDPGFLPFDWIRTRKMKYSYQELLSGLAYRQDQINFASYYRPTFASFSTESGRFIIRGDHICIWINNWVGKRNHKQFILMLFWGSMSGFLCFVLKYQFIYEIFNIFSFLTELGFFPFFLLIFSTFFEIGYGAILFGFFIYQIFNLCLDRTAISIYKNVSNQNVLRCTSMREVCGHGSVFSWFIPTPAFDDLL